MYSQIRKGVHPYDYVNTWGKTNETELQSKDQFYSKLYNEHKSVNDYDRAKLVCDRLIQKIWESTVTYIQGAMFYN